MIMLKKEDLFVSSNIIETGSNEQYKKIPTLINAVKMFSHIVYQSIYLIDYSRQSFLYVSDNPLFLCGLTAKEVKELGYTFYLKNVPKEDQKMLREISNNGLKFFNGISDIDKRKCSISYDFHLLKGNKKNLVNHKLTPTLLTDNGNIWIVTCIVSLSSQKSAGHIEFHINDSKNYWEFSLKSHKWKENHIIILKEEEKDVIRLSSEGFTMNEIADIMFKSIDTIKFYKRNLFEKLKVSNITEALTYAISYKLL